MQLLLATTNPGKIRELRLMLGELPVDLLGLETADSTDEIETGVAFAENALLKARHYHRAGRSRANRGGDLVTIADDSGLEVEALGGRPGIGSARYAGPEASDADRIAKLLGELKEVPSPRRGARFVCVAAAVWDGGERTFTGEARGRLLAAPRGTGGFGYDPLFLYEPLGKTFAELTELEKAAISHRGRALHDLVVWLKKTLETGI